MTAIINFADAFVSFNMNVKANNQKKVAKIATMLRDAEVVKMLNAQKIVADDFNVALYTTEKVVEMIFALTRKTFDASALEINTTSALKSLLNAQKIDETLTKQDVYASIMIDAKDARAHVYQRKTRIASEAQVNYTFAALRLMNVASSVNNTTLKAKDCKLLKLASEKLDQVVV